MWKTSGNDGISVPQPGTHRVETILRWDHNDHIRISPEIAGNFAEFLMVRPNSETAETKR
jgi:hypothetical protein